MNHAVQIIGYNFEDGPVPYWVARNQWGASFGENGLVRIKYGTNVCGMSVFNIQKLLVKVKSLASICERGLSY